MSNDLFELPSYVLGFVLLYVSENLIVCHDLVVNVFAYSNPKLDWVGVVINVFFIADPFDPCSVPVAIFVVLL